MKHKPTALVCVLDAVGITTLEYMFDTLNGTVNIPNLTALGLGELMKQRHRDILCGRMFAGRSYCASLTQASATADSTTGHREMVGVIDARVYNLFPNGFPKAYIAALEARIGRLLMFNQMAGGMDAITRNASEHERTGSPILYASKCDPLVQIAMNEGVIPVPEQHRIAEAALAVAVEMGIPITRAIARAYVRTADGEITRTANRHDAVLPLGGKTLVDVLREQNVWTVAVGKTADLVNTDYDDVIKITRPEFVDPKFASCFPHPRKKDTNPLNAQGVLHALTVARHTYQPRGTFVFANFVDTDSLYGHTRDVEGAIYSLEAFDRMLGHFQTQLSDGDLLIVTADHGMRHEPDYGYHNNEPLPLLVQVIEGDHGLGGLRTGRGEGLTEVGLLVAEYFDCSYEFRNVITRIPA